MSPASPIEMSQGVLLWFEGLGVAVHVGDYNEQQGSRPPPQLIDYIDGRLSVDEAAALMGLGRRQVYRLKKAFEGQGPAALVSKCRGKPGNHVHGKTFKRAVLALVREQYDNLGRRLPPRSYMRFMACRSAPRHCGNG